MNVEPRRPRPPLLRCRATGRPAAEPLEPRLLLDAGQISGQLWEDLNGSGAHDAGDRGLDGWTVVLRHAATGDVAATTVTAAADRNGNGQIDPETEQGLYAFEGVPPGEYEVRLTVPAGFVQVWPGPDYRRTLAEQDTLFQPNVVRFDFDDAPPPATGATLTVTAVGDLDGSSEFLYLLAEGVVLGKVFHDNGRQYDPVTAVLHLSRGDLAAIAADGTISVEVWPSSKVDNLEGAESITAELAFDSGWYPASVADGSSLEGLDFGVFALAAIRGARWDDLDRDGLRDAGEPGLDGWIVELRDAATQQILATTVTASVDLDADGQIDPASERGVYSFEGLAPGSYDVRVVPIAGWQETAPPAGAHTVTLSSGGSSDGLDFGGFALAAVRGQVWEDADADGLRDGDEAGTDGWTVELVDPDTGTVLETAVTGSRDADGDGTIEAMTEQGLYAFEQLVPGRYEVRVRPGGDWAVTSPESQTYTPELANGELREGVDFGLAPPPMNAPPVLTAVEPLTGALEDEAFAISYDALLAAGDAADPEGHDLSFRVESLLAGSLSRGGQPVAPGELLSPGEQLTWAPPADAHGTFDAFAVTAWDGEAASFVAVPVSVVVEAVNDPPTLTAVAPLTGAVGGDPFVISYEALAAAANEADLDADPLGFRVEAVAAGTLTKGGQPVIPGQTVLAQGEQLTWTPDAAAIGVVDAFEVVAWDGQAGSDPPVTVRASVVQGNHAPTLDPAATLDGAREDEPFAISWADLAAATNAADADGDTLGFRVEPVAAGTLLINGQPVTPGETTLAQGEELTWLSPANAFGAIEAFAVRAWDGQAASASAAAVTVDVAPVNDAPQAAADEAATDEDAPVVIDDVLANDTDADGDGLTVAAYTQPAHGTVACHGDGTFTYAPAGDFHGADSFSYTVSDGAGASDAATVTITVAPVNDAPAAADLSLAVAAGAAVQIALAGSDVETAGTDLLFAIVGEPARGSVSVEGSVATYVSDPTYAGDVSFRYTVTDRGDPDGVAASPALTSQPANVTLTCARPLTAVALDGPAKVLNYTDADGTAVWVVLRGDGRLEARFVGLDVRHEPTRYGAVVRGDELALAELALTQTTRRSALVIVADRGGDAGAEVGSISTDGDLAGLVGAAVRLTGDLRVAGVISVLVLGDVFSAAIDLNADGRALLPRDRAVVVLGRVADSRLDAHGLPIAALTAAEWADADGQPNEAIAAPWIGRLAVTGRAGGAGLGAAGDLGADVSLDGAGLLTGQLTLGIAYVAGQIVGGTWTVGGSVGVIAAAGAAGDWALDAAGSVRVVYARGDLGASLSAAWFGRIIVGGDVDGASIAAGGTDAAGASLYALAAGAVRDTSLELAGGAWSIAAAEWINGSGGGERIAAAWIGRLAVVGRPANPRTGDGPRAGDFHTDLALSGAGLSANRATLGLAYVAGGIEQAAWTVGGRAAAVYVAGGASGWTLDLSAPAAGGEPAARLGSIVVGGDLAGSTWRVEGEVGWLTVRGSAVGSTIRSAGGIRAVALGAAFGTDVLAGVADGVARRAAAAADFANADARIGLVRIVGLRPPPGEPLGRLLGDSNFSAAGIGTVSLMNAEGGDAYGLFVLGGPGETIGWVSYVDTVSGERWIWRPARPLPTVGGFIVEVLAG